MGTEKFENALRKAAKKSSWVKWLTGDSGAQETRDFLKMSYSNLTPNEQSKWAQRASTGDANQIMATIHELVALELLRRLQLVPKYEPSVNGLKPDISFNCSGQEFLADVYLTHSPKKTVKRIDDWAWESQDEGDRAWKIEEELTKKAMKYDKCGLPLVLFIFLGDYYGLHLWHVEEALFGRYWAEFKFTKGDLLASTKDHRLHPHGYGLFLRKILGLCHPRNLSAVVACEWFDTLNRKDPGKRLNCLVIHHWDDDICELPITAFGDFPQIVWSHKGPDIWEWRYTTKDTLVAKLPSTGGLEFGIYTADDPW